MNPVIHCCPESLAAAINAGLPQPGDRVPAGSLAALALMAVLGCVTGAEATTFVVNTAGDPGSPGTTSLRQAVAAANLSSGNFVEFNSSLIGSSITLSNGEIAFNHAMHIVGPGSGKLTISGNDASRIFDFSGDITKPSGVYISGLTLTQGNVSAAIYDQGGAIYSYGAYPLMLKDMVISGNRAATGGGLYVNQGSTTLDHVRVSGNYATLNGGGIAAASTVSSVYYLNVTSSTISGNSTNGYGGGVMAIGLYGVAVTESLISGNRLLAPAVPTAHQGGGGIALMNLGYYNSYYHQQRGFAQLFNSTISGNSAYARGGGIGIFDAATGNLTQCFFSTITGNDAYAYGYGNGIYALGKPSISSSIVANNASRQDDADLVGNFSAQYSLIKTLGSATLSGGTPGDIFGHDPLLGPLTDNGGPTLSMLPAATSPVINTGGGLGPVGQVDQRGLPRPAGAGDDIGAVERQFPEGLIFRNGFDPR